MANTSIQGGTGKSLIGGDGAVGTITIGGDANEIDYLSPRNIIFFVLHKSKLDSEMELQTMPSDHSRLQSQFIRGADDWEMKDFDGTTAGTDYDVMNFSNLTFGSVVTVLPSIYWELNLPTEQKVHPIILQVFGENHAKPMDLNFLRMVPEMEGYNMGGMEFWKY